MEAFEILPKRRNFDKSGHTVQDTWIVFCCYIPSFSFSFSLSLSLSQYTLSLALSLSRFKCKYHHHEQQQDHYHHTMELFG